MKNIGIFTHDLYPYKPWGQGRYVYELAKNLRRVYEGKIFVFSPSPGIDDPYHVEVFGGSHASVGKNIGFSIKLGFVLESLIRKYDLGLVHYQGGPGGLFLIKKPSVPVIYTVHHTYYQQSAYIENQRWKKLLFLWEMFSYRKSDLLICVSPSTQRVLTQQYRLKNASGVIPNGVDRARFFDLGAPRIPNSMLFMGRLEKRKGIDFLLKCMPKIKAGCENVRLYIAGSGVLKRKLEEMVCSLNLHDNIQFFGVIDDSEVNEWYNRVALIVIPSVFEGFGLNAIEAMSCGTPVIATDVNGLRDVVEDGVSGRLVPYNDVEGLSECVLDLLRDDRKRQWLAENGKNRVKALYDWQNISRQVAKIYQLVIGGSGEAARFHCF
jgi:glycosyltransferase involved in cell wall biosynthesis